MSVSKLRIIARYQGLANRLRKDQDGVAAVEFAIICVPFFMMLFGIMGASFWFFKTFLVEKAVWDASRDMRTGVFQSKAGEYGQAAADVVRAPGESDASYAARQTEAWKLSFKTAICRKAMLSTVSGGDCDNDMRVLVQSQTNFNGIAAPSCLSGGSLVTDASVQSAFNAGGASAVVLVTACYQWKFASSLPFLKFGNMTNGARLIQGSASFRSEPFN
jgi:Flp pilus assembly protein TadG